MPLQHRNCLLMICAIALLAAHSAHAQSAPQAEPANKLETILGNTPENKLPPKMLPKLEYGLAVGAATMPDYRGADHRTNYVIPLPYVIYRGPILRADRGGVRARFLDSERLDLELSGGGGVPVNSKHNEARQGMPNLKGTIEIGPQAIFRIVGKARDVTRLDLQLPVRKVVTASLSPHSVGWVFTPNVNLSITPRDSWHFGAQAGLYYGSTEYHKYFYEVTPQYATATRPAYSPKGGYGGWQVTTSLSRTFDKIRVGAYVRASSVNGAVFESGPLIKRKTNLQGGLGISWLFGQSSEMVAATDDD